MPKTDAPAAAATARERGRTEKGFDMAKRSIDHQKFGMHTMPRREGRLLVHETLRLLGPVVYAAKVDGLIKIGFTTDLSNRCHTLGITYQSLLGWRSGTWDDEQSIHDSLGGRSVRGREWYPIDDDAVLRVVNELRSSLGVAAL